MRLTRHEKIMEKNPKAERYQITLLCDSLAEVGELSKSMPKLQWDAGRMTLNEIIAAFNRKSEGDKNS